MVYLVIRKSNQTVFQVHYGHDDPTGRYSKEFEVKEWHGNVPPIHNPENNVESYDPTIGLPPDDPLIISKVDMLEKRIETLESALVAMEA
jgi:hypothetical protein